MDDHDIVRVVKEGLPRELIIDGVYMPPNYTPEKVLSAREYKPDDSDVFVCSYPKAGTTWTQMIVYMLMHDGKLPPAGVALSSITPAIECCGCDHVHTEMLPPRLIKSHLYYQFLPQNPTTKYIYVVRNPKDTLVSYYFHYLSLANTRYFWPEGKLDEFFTLFCQGRVSHGDYFDHLHSWLPHIRDPNVLFVTYEERLDDLEAGVKEIANFIGGKPRQLIKDEQVLSQIVKECSFEEMKKDQRGRYFGNDAIRDGPLQFLRKGEKGDWKNHLNREQSDTMNVLFRQKMKGTEAEHWYQKEMEWIDQ